MVRKQPINVLPREGPGAEGRTSSAPDQRIAINTLSRYISMTVTMAIGFLLLPFLLRSIGKSGYALQSLSHQALQFVTMLAVAVGISYDRIAATYYARGDYDRMNAVLSAGLALSLLVAGIIALATALMAIFAATLLNIQADLLPSARWVLCIFGVGATFQIINAVYCTPVFMTQRLYLSAIGSMLDSVIAAALVIPLFIFGHPSIVTWVGLSVGARLATQWFLIIPLGKRGMHQLKIRLFAVGARKEMRGLIHFGGLSLIGSMGVLLYYATDSIMITNLKELGLAQVANYNVAQRWFPQIAMFAAAFVWILGPAMTGQAAKSQFEELRATVASATRYCFIILAYPCLLLIIQAEPFLRLWLKSEFEPATVPVMRVIMCALLTSGASIVAKEALYACRKIRHTVIATLVGGILNVILSITLVKVAGMGLLGIAVGSLTSLFLLDVVCMPYFLCKELSLSGGVLLRGAGRAFLGAVPLAAACLALGHVWTPTSLLQIFIQFFLCGVVYAPTVWLVSMTRMDRQALLRSVHTGWETYRNRRLKGPRQAS